MANPFLIEKVIRKGRINNPYPFAMLDCYRSLNLRISFILLFGLILVTNVYPRTSQSTERVTGPQITLAIEERLAQDDQVPEQLIDIAVQEGIATLQGEVDNILARERATALAETIRGVRSVINRIIVNPSSPVEDQELKSHIVAALLDDPVTELYDINVQVQDSRVTLSGAVQSWSEKQLAVEVVKGVRGVSEVKDEIKIHVVENRSNQAIKAEITRSLASDVWISAGSISVKVNNGTVTLSGTVPTAAQKSRATQLSWVYGITDVDNEELDVNMSTANQMQRSGFAILSNPEIQQAVNDSLVYDPRIGSSSRINIKANDGLITLTGTVESLRAKLTAEENALNTTGAYKVINLLKVRSTRHYSDDDIEGSVKATFFRDPLIDPEDIAVTVHNGTVHLRGKVDTRLQKTRATTLSSSVKGVSEVSNQLKHPIKWLWKSDFELREDIQDRLWWSPFMPNQSISVTVEDGVAILTGTVNSFKQKHTAGEAAYDAGARSVQNELRIKSLK